MTGRLREVTDEFLIHENQGRPDVLGDQAIVVSCLNSHAEHGHLW